MSFAKKSSLAVLALAAFAGAAGAQQVYRILGPDGKVTFSDKPPADPAAKAAPAPSVAMPGRAAAGGGASGNLPFELRQVASRYPVTLYAGPNCVPCGAGRSFLSQRGIPFSEKTVSSADDVDALNRLSGGSPGLPLLTIGGQQLKGFSETEWSQFLDAAGYPRTSQLPTGYRPPAPTPLVTSQPVQSDTAAAAPDPAAPAARVPAPAIPLPSGSNPAGITF